MIKTSEIFTKVAEIATTNPDITYQDRLIAMDFDGEVEDAPCLYAYNGQPACIVGMALNELGMSIETLEKFDSAGETINAVVRDHPDLFQEDGCIDDLYSIQRKQDAGWSFKKAFDCR